MQTYETIFITPPTLSEDEERTTVETLAGVVTDGGGSFAVNERMGRRRLAYPIEKHHDGVYVRFLYDSEADVPRELERRIRLSDKVLRVLTVRMEPDWAVASKEQAVRDAQARVEAAEREKEREREAAELAVKQAAEQEQAEAEAAAGGEPASDEALEASESEGGAAPDAAEEPESTKETES